MKRIYVSRIQSGAIIETRKGDMLVLRINLNKRCRWTYTGILMDDFSILKKDPTDRQSLRFWTFISRVREDQVAMIGQASPKELKRAMDFEEALEDGIYKDQRENFKALDPKWNDNVGRYDVTTLKGEKVKAGDIVMVRFTNGDYKMVMGNAQGQTYVGNTGRFLCREIYKVNRMQKTKARSMPAKSLLFLVEPASVLRS